MSPRLEHKLLGDIGATNARFALLAEGVLGPVEWLEVARYASFTDAVGTFLNQDCQRVRITDALLAVAGPVAGGRCVLHNYSWVICAGAWGVIFGLTQVYGMNRTLATALA